jgi:hypothetical protein
MKHVFLVFLAGMVSAAPAPEPPGHIQVTVSLEGEDPGLPHIRTDKNEDFCGETLADPILLVNEGKVANTVMFLDFKDPVPKPEDLEPISLKSNHCLMAPRIQTTWAGVFLRLNSGDKITHNPHGWLNDDITVFNITLMDPTMSFKRKLKRPGKYRVDCDTHSWMRAYIWTFTHPYHGVTGEDGVGVIRDIPPGTYTVHLWHEVLGEMTKSIVVKPGETVVWEPIFALVDHRKETLKPNVVEPWPKRKGGH